jgi:CubicO group peptidase (beta-lactamase class C family)
MKLRFLVALIVLISFSKEVISQDKRAIVIDQLLSGLYKKHLFNGAIVTGQNGEIIFSKGYGYASFQDSIPFTPDTPADGGSNAKTLTAASILLLASEGKLKLTDSIQQYLPNYPYENTTVWNFITHSVGGLPDYDYFFRQATDSVTVTTALNVDILNKNKPSLTYLPNTNFYYDNVGFDIAALLVEKLTRESYYKFLQEKLFNTLKMNSSFVRPARLTNWNNRTIGYSYQNDSLQLFDIADREGFYGGCNIWFTAKDLYHYGESFYGHPVFPDSIIKQITSTVFINGKLSHVRLGAWYQGKTKNAFYYWGNVAGFYSWLYWDKEKKFTISFMTNTNMPQWLRPLLTSALVDIMTDKSSSSIKEPQRSIIDKNRLTQVAGIYELERFGKIKITVSGSIVNMKLNNGMKYRMHLVDKTSFYVPGFDPWISFSSLKDDRFQNIYWSSTVLQTKGKRVSDLTSKP